MRARRSAGALVLAVSALVAGCGTATGSGHGVVRGSAPRGPVVLATSLTTATGSWAVAVMGGSAASHNNFWQLFVRPAGASRWRLATPPGVADNGGLVVAAAGGRSLITAFRPSQFLTYTPLAVTEDGGHAWVTAGPLDAAIADDPDALAAAPRGRRLLALLTTGAARLAIRGYTRWTTLVGLRALARTAAGRRCGLTSLTAAAFTASAVPLLAGSCDRPGTAGIFALHGQAWQAAGPALPASLSRQRITVLRLTRTATGTVALLEAGAGSAASVLVGWSAATGSGGHWALSPPVRLGRARLTSSSFGPADAAAIILNGSRGLTIAGPAASWRSLPTLPAGTATLTPGPAGGYSALAVHRARLTVWQLGTGQATWQSTQVLKVPIQFGSSG